MLKKKEVAFWWHRNATKSWYQIAAFSLVGIVGVIIDLTVLNTAMFLTGLSAGASFLVFKTLSFSVAVYHNFFWNRHWVFSSQNEKRFEKFYLASLLSGIINIGIAALLVHTIHPAELSPQLWANIASLLGIACGSLSNFLQYKYVVFRE